MVGRATSKKLKATPVAPISYEQLIVAITDRHRDLARGYQEVGRYIVQNPNEIALRSAKYIADQIGVQASTLVRFSQAFGYSGFADMQRVFQARLLTAAPGFTERLDALRNELGVREHTGISAMMRDLVTHDIAAMHRLIDTFDDNSVLRAADMMAKASTIHLLGQMRSYPIAVYLRYVLLHLRKDCRLIDGAGGLAVEQASVIHPSHLMIAVSFRYYAREVVDIVENLAQRGVPIISITDSPLSPLAKHSTVTLFCPEGENNFSNSLAAPMCLAQALTMSMAENVEPKRFTRLAE
jgi:DNA-binding MurR/RpiR family transcriptional regulator